MCLGWLKFYSLTLLGIFWEELGKGGLPPMYKEELFIVLFFNLTLQIKIWLVEKLLMAGTRPFLGTEISLDEIDYTVSTEV